MSRLWGVATLCVYVSAAVSEPYGLELISDINFLNPEPSKRKEANIDALLTAQGLTGGVKFEELNFVSTKSNKQRQASAAFQWDANTMDLASPIAAKKRKASKVSEVLTLAKKGNTVKVVKKDPAQKSWREEKDDAAEEYHFKMQMTVCPLGDNFKACMAKKNAGKNSNLQTKAKMNASLKTKLKNKGKKVMNATAMLSKGNSSNVSGKTKLKTVKKAQALLAEEDDDDEPVEPSWGQLQGLKDMLGGLPPNPFFVAVDKKGRKIM